MPSTPFLRVCVTMPRKRVTNVAWLRIKAEKRAQKAKVLQQREGRLFRIDQLKEEEREQTPPTNDKGQGGRGKKSKSINPSIKQFDIVTLGQTASNGSSKILDTLRKEPTYCLTGSKLFWQMNDRENDSGRWRP